MALAAQVITSPRVKQSNEPLRRFFQCLILHLMQASDYTARYGRIALNARDFLWFTVLSVAGVLLCDARAAENAERSMSSKPPKEYTIEQFMKTVRVGGADFSADDKKILFYNNQSGI